jgi:KDO2-lipid IV(A) lauroyltransferase
VLSLLPFCAALFLGRILGRVAFLVDRRGRDRAVSQIRAALGLPDPEARGLAARSYASIGMVAVEIGILPRIRRVFSTYVELADADAAVLREAYALGRGVVFVTGHVGNWELLAQRILLDGYDGATVAREAPNPFIGAWLERRRSEGRLETINRGEPRAARRILAALKRGALLGVLMDQDTKVESIHVPFFGRPAATPIAAARLAIRGDVPVVAGFIRRTAGGHRIALERVDLTGIDDVGRATALFTRRIEEAIRRAPEEWVWFHDRWKTPPA